MRRVSLSLVYLSLRGQSTSFVELWSVPMFANIRQSIADWIFRATVPEASPVTLSQRRIFILPTRQGYFFARPLTADKALEFYRDRKA